MNALDQLPTRVLKARDLKLKKEVDVLVDGDYDGEYLSQFPWYILPSGYVVHGLRPIQTDRTGKRIARSLVEKGMIRYLHHYVLPRKKGLWRTFKNGNKLDCRSRNIIYTTPSDSALRRPFGVNTNTFGYRGIVKVNGHYYAHIRNKYILPYHLTAYHAAKAYDKAAKEAWGDRAILNFPQEG